MGNKVKGGAPIFVSIEEEEFWNRLRGILGSEIKAALQEVGNRNIPGKLRTEGFTQKPLYDMEDVRNLFGDVSRSTIYEWIDAGILKPRKSKGKVFFLWADIEKKLKEEEGVAVPRAK